MSKSSDHFDAFEPHTLLKHAILRGYVPAFALKLLLWGRAGEVVYFLDGFAGAGQDESRNPGSPLIAARAALEVSGTLAALPGGRRGRLRVRAIEKNKVRHEALAQLLEPFNRVNDPDLVRTARGTLSDHIDALLEEIGSAPTLTFLDPFGVKGLDASIYPRLLAGPHNEIFALFADMGANRLHGLVIAGRSDVDEQIAALRAYPSLFSEDDALEEQRIRKAAAQRDDALDLSKDACREHLVRALGDPGVIEELAAIPPAERPDGFVRAFIRSMLRAGARYVLVIPMRNADGLRVYSLVHASKSAKGFTAMKETVSTSIKKEDFPEEMRSRIREDLSMPIPEVIELLRKEFAGRGDVAWSGERGQEAGTVRCYLLESTPVFHFQANDVRDALKAAGILRTVNRKMVCAFPPISGDGGGPSELSSR